MKSRDWFCDTEGNQDFCRATFNAVTVIYGAIVPQGWGLRSLMGRRIDADQVHGFGNSENVRNT